MCSKIKSAFLAFLFSFLFWMPSSYAAFFPQNASATYGDGNSSVSLTDLANRVVLYCNTSSGKRYCTFRKEGGTAGYTPSGSKKFRMYSFCIQNISAASIQSVLFVSSNDVGTLSGFDASGSGITAPTVVKYIGSTSITSNSLFSPASATAGYLGCKPVDFTVPNTDFLSIDNQGTAVFHTYMAIGYEE